MKCKFLYNYYEDENDFDYIDFELDINCVSGFGVEGKVIVLIVDGGLYHFKYEERIIIAVRHNIAMRQSFKMN